MIQFPRQDVVAVGGGGQIHRRRPVIAAAGQQQQANNKDGQYNPAQRPPEPAAVFPLPAAGKQKSVHPEFRFPPILQRSSG